MPELIVKLKERELQRFPICGVKTSIGRDPGNDLVLDNMGISRHHLTVEMNGQEFFVQDQSSANGVFVNGSPSRRTRLFNGDTIQIGKFSIVFSASGGAPVDKLARNALLADPSARAGGVLNPEMTTALAPEDISKFIASGGHNPLQPAPAGAPAAPMQGHPVDAFNPARISNEPSSGGWGQAQAQNHAPHARQPQRAPQHAPQQRHIPQHPGAQQSQYGQRPVQHQAASPAAPMRVGHPHAPQHQQHAAQQPVTQRQLHPQHPQHPQEQRHQQFAHQPQQDMHQQPQRFVGTMNAAQQQQQLQGGNGTMFGEQNYANYLERQATTFRTLTIVLGVAVVSLMGLTVALLVLG